MRHLFWLTYQAIMLTVLLLAGPFLLASRGSHYLPTLSGRLGRPGSGQKRSKAHPLWIHAVSVGEVEVAATFLKRLGKQAAEPVLVTTITPTGQERARATLASHARVSYLPFELGFAQRAFMRSSEPGSLVLVEGELWPLLQRRLNQRETPIVMINGRISDRSFSRLAWFHRHLPALLGPLLDPVTHFGVQTKQDQDRLRTVGVDADRITITGNLKFDAEPPKQHAELDALVRKVAQGRPVIVAGSTMPGEEDIVLDAFRQTCALSISDGDLAPMLILAPRHPERFNQVERLCLDRGLNCLRRTAISAATSDTQQSEDVLLLDTLGELASMYHWAGAAFVGGTLVPTGGHNPLEPARCQAPVSVGPSMENFKEIADAFDQLGAWRRATDATELAALWHDWLSRPESDEPGSARSVVQAATALLEDNTGATDRSIELLARHAPAALSTSQNEVRSRVQTPMSDSNA